MSKNIKMNIINKIAKINEKKIKILENITVLFLSMFLSYMVVIWPIVDYPKRTIVFFVIFMVPYLWFSLKLLKSKNELIDYSLKISKGIKLEYLKNVKSFLLFIPSLILGLSSIIFLSMILFYLNMANKVFGEPAFHYYYLIAERWPSKIYLVIILALLLHFFLQTFFISKIKKIKKTIIIGLSFISTISVFFICLFVILIGIILYYIGGSFFY